MDSVALDEIYQRGRGVDWQPISEENWEKEIQSVPLFMTHQPSEDDVHSNPQLNALQSILYDDDGTQGFFVAVNLICVSTD